MTPSEQTGWTTYYNARSGRPPRPLLVDAMARFSANSHNLALEVTTTAMPTTSTATFALSMTLMRGTSTQWYQPCTLVTMLLLTTIPAVIVKDVDQTLSKSILT